MAHDRVGGKASSNDYVIAENFSDTTDDNDSPKQLSLDEALSKTPLGMFHYRLLFICGVSFASDALEVSLLSYIPTCAGAEWHLSFGETASISSFVFGGELLGSLIWGYIADSYGRKLCYSIACSMIVIGGILSAFASNLYWLLFYRAIVGFGVGGVVVPFDLLAEFLPLAYRGRFLIYVEYYWSAATILLNALAWYILSYHNWRVLAFVTVIPVFIGLLYSVVYLPESPRWLLTKGRKSEANNIVRSIIDECCNRHSFEPFSLRSDNTFIKESNMIDLFASKSVRKMTIPLLILWFAFGFVYNGLVLFVSVTYTDQSQIHGTSFQYVCSFEYQSIFISTLAEIAGVTIAIFSMDKWGRVNTQCVFYAIAAFVLVIMGLKPSSIIILISSWLSRLAVVSALSITWVATPELFPTALRASGHGLCNGLARLGAFFAPYMVVSTLSPLLISLGLACMSFIASITSWTLIDTSNMNLDDAFRDGEETNGFTSFRGDNDIDYEMVPSSHAKADKQNHNSLTSTAL